MTVHRAVTLLPSSSFTPPQLPDSHRTNDSFSLELYAASSNNSPTSPSLERLSFILYR